MHFSAEPSDVSGYRRFTSGFKSKTLYIIGDTQSVFDRALSPVFEIESDQPTDVIALSGELAASKYLWSNPTRHPDNARPCNATPTGGK